MIVPEKVKCLCCDCSGVFTWRLCHSHSLILPASSPTRASTLCKGKSDGLSWLQPIPFLLTFLCALLLFSKWCVRAGQGVSLPLEHLLKMENKMHCDIFAKRPFSGFGKRQLNRHSLSHSRKKTTQSKCHLRACLPLHFQHTFDYSSFLFLRIRGQSHSSSAFLLIKVSLPLLIKAAHMRARLAQLFPVSNWQEYICKCICT